MCHIVITELHRGMVMFAVNIGIVVTWHHMLLSLIYWYNGQARWYLVSLTSQ